jgi:hypothetical protein
MTVRLDIFKDAIAVASENYKDNVRIFASLDDKAQKMGGIAGLFLGVLLALVKPDQMGTLLTAIGTTGVWVLTSVILLLITCVIFSLWCMWTGRISAPLSLGHMKMIVDNLAEESELDEKAQETYCKERIAIWKTCIEDQTKVAIRKHWRLLAAQIVLLIAILLVAGMLLYLINTSQLVTQSPAPL